MRTLNRTRHRRRACYTRMIGFRGRPLPKRDLGTSGSYYAHGVAITFGGACPVQGYGTVDGYSCYYRSRGEGWQFHLVAPGVDVEANDGRAYFDNAAFIYEDYPYRWPDGGWVEPKVSRKCIARAVEVFRSQSR